MKKLLLGLTFFALIFSGCAGSRSDDPEAIDSALVGFTSCVQGSRWQEALEYVNEDEARAISPDGYEFKEEYKIAARRLPLSTLRKAGLEVDGRGRLVGIKDAMDEANERYVMSEEQAKVGTNLKQMEDERIKRRLEEGQKILKEEEEAANQEQEEIVFSNKLTEEEKRKYGSTRDLQAPEAVPDADVEEAEEEIHGDYESD
ncbi:hypothetical protein [Fibrobacter sp. UWP2]|jgi:hypothetical protein|uniref:hypothetical protein n=1 Tax=Fibrobacter sp. UWP2 TaxID=1896216 RepID=UPI00091B612D|nr:hypothetical protein [Fibrobacter sp. UWP2]SHI68239.1 hypothetical protein SAMN05720471_105108 [Fibrobacter sp. UWP2]